MVAANDYDVLAGDIGNAYLYASCNMNIYCRLGKEFNITDSRIPAGSLAKVEQALYGLPTSANMWHAHLRDHLLGMGFSPTRYDSDVWIRENGKHHYDYLGTPTDDLLCVSNRADEIMADLQKTYEIKKVAPPEFHLGCDYRKNDNGQWQIGTITHAKEALKKVRTLLGRETKEDGADRLGRQGVPMQEKLKPELDSSPLLDAEGHRNYQQLIGIAQWLITCGRLDLNFATSSLSRFSAAPREGHMKAAVHMFKYLNQHPDKWITIDPSPHKPPGEITSPIHDNGVDLEDMDWKSMYPYAREEKDHKFPEPRVKAIDSTVYFDSNWAHDEKTRRSISGIIGFLGNTPVTWSSKRQGAIATSTYSAELCAAKVAAEEAITLRYMLRSLGVNMDNDKPTTIVGDNLGSLISATNPGTPCKKKHSHIAYHYVRECVAAGILKVMKIHTTLNYADANTKPLGKNSFWLLYSKIYNNR